MTRIKEKIMKRSIKHKILGLLTVCTFFFTCGVTADEVVVSTADLAERTETVTSGFHTADELLVFANNLTQCVNEQAGEGFNKNLSMEEIEAVIESYKQFVEVCNQRLNRDFPVHFGAYFNRGDAPSFEVFFYVTSNETIFPELGEGEARSIPSAERVLALAESRLQANRMERRSLRKERKELQQFQNTMTKEALSHYRAFFESRKDEMSEKEPFLTDQIHKMEEIYNQLLVSQQSAEEAVKQAQIASEEVNSVFLEKSSAVKKQARHIQFLKSALNDDFQNQEAKESFKLNLSSAERALSKVQKELELAEQAYKTAETALDEAENIVETVAEALESFRESLLNLYRDFFPYQRRMGENEGGLGGQQTRELKK